MSANLINYFKSKKVEIENNLKSVGLQKCSKCGFWMDKEHIKKGACNQCQHINL